MISANVSPGTFIKLGTGETAMMRVTYYDKDRQELCGVHALGYPMSVDYRYVHRATGDEIRAAKASKFWALDKRVEWLPTTQGTVQAVAQTDTISVCPWRDLECGHVPHAWCLTCPKRQAVEAL